MAHPQLGKVLSQKHEKGGEASLIPWLSLNRSRDPSGIVHGWVLLHKTELIFLFLKYSLQPSAGNGGDPAVEPHGKFKEMGNVEFFWRFYPKGRPENNKHEITCGFLPLQSPGESS